MLEGFLFSSGNDLVLQYLAEIAEVIAVSCNADYEVPILLWVGLGCPKGFRCDYVELDMMTIQLEVRSDQVGQIVEAFFSLQQ